MTCIVDVFQFRRGCCVTKKTTDPPKLESEVEETAWAVSQRCRVVRVHNSSRCAVPSRTAYASASMVTGSVVYISGTGPENGSPGALVAASPLLWPACRFVATRRNQIDISIFALQPLQQSLPPSAATKMSKPAVGVIPLHARAVPCHRRLCLIIRSLFFFFLFGPLFDIKRHYTDQIYCRGRELRENLVPRTTKVLFFLLWSSLLL